MTFTARLLTSLLTCLLIFPAHAADDAMFEPGRISDDGVFGLTLSPDGQHALWVQSSGKRDVLVILESHKVDGKWQAPAPVSFSGRPGWKDIDPAFSPDGKSLIFQSNRPVDGKPERKGFDIYSVALKDGKWSARAHLGHVINSDESESSGSIAANGTIYFMKNGMEGKSDLWRSRLAGGQYQATENLGAPINTGPWRESNPYVAPDESYVIYFSDDAHGLGDVDLYISFRTADGWSAPRNLGGPYNTADAEFTPWVHGGRLYLARQRKNGERFVENIYSYPFDPARYR